MPLDHMNMGSGDIITLSKAKPFGGLTVRTHHALS